MNYSDFPDIQQDEWSLTRPIFPTPIGGILKVLGWVRRSKGSCIKKYLIECSRCKGYYNDGIFEVTKRELLRGDVPCKCSARWTTEQITEKIKKQVEIHGCTFIGWIHGIGDSHPFEYTCRLHGSQVSRPTGFIGCYLCRCEEGQKECYINIISDLEIPVAIKFGMSKNSLSRLKQQNSRNLFKMEQVAVYNFQHVKACKDAEKACKRELKCGILSSRELKDGHSETVSLLDIDKVIEIYNRYGGVKVK